MFLTNSYYQPHKIPLYKTSVREVSDYLLGCYLLEDILGSSPQLAIPLTIQMFY